MGHWKKRPSQPQTARQIRDSSILLGSTIKTKEETRKGEERGERRERRERRDERKDISEPNESNYLLPLFFPLAFFRGFFI